MSLPVPVRRLATIAALALALSPIGTASAQELYGIAKFTDTEGLVLIDLETGASASVSDERFDIDATGADFGCDGRLYGFSRLAGVPTLYTLDLESGAMTIVTDFPDLAAVTGNIGFEFDEAEVPHAILADELYRLDPATSTSTFVGSTGYDGHANLALGPDGLFRTVGHVGGVPSYLSLDPATAEVVVLGTDAVQSATSIVILPSGRLLAHKSRDLHELDPDTGELVQTIGSLGRRVHGLAWGPEPPVDPMPAAVGNILRVARVGDDLVFGWTPAADVGGFELLEHDAALGDPDPETMDAAELLAATTAAETTWRALGRATAGPSSAFHQLRALSPCPLSLRPGPTCDGFPAQVECP